MKDLVNIQVKKKNIAKGGIQDTLFREIKALVLSAAQSKIPFGSHEALTCARHTLTLNEENLEWNLDLQQSLEILWEDTGIKAVYTEKNYFLENFKRIVVVDYYPTDEDVAKLEEIYANEPEPEIVTPITNNTTTSNNSTNTTNNTTPNITNTNNTTNNTTQTDVNSDPRKVSQSNLNSGDQVLLLITVPALNITKLLKAAPTERAPELVEKLRKKPGVTLTEPNNNYVCWLNRTGQQPVLVDNNTPLSNYNLKNNDPIMLLKAGEKPEEINFKTFHNSPPLTTSQTTLTGSKKDKDKGKKKDRTKTTTTKKIKDSKKKKKDKEKKDTLTTTSNSNM